MRAWSDAAVAYLGTRTRNVVNPEPTDSDYRAMLDLMTEARDQAAGHRRDDVIGNLAALRDGGG